MVLLTRSTAFRLFLFSPFLSRLPPAQPARLLSTLGNKAIGPSLFADWFVPPPPPPRVETLIRGRVVPIFPRRNLSGAIAGLLEI